MSDFVTPILMSLAGSAVERGWRQGAQGVVIVSELVLAAIFGLGAVACLSAAIWLFLIPHAGVVGAPLIVAAILAVAAMVMMVLPRLTVGRRQQASQPVLDPAMLAEVSKTLKDHKGSLLLMALFAGLVLGGTKR
jgi:hypothetical protein